MKGRLLLLVAIIIAMNCALKLEAQFTVSKSAVMVDADGDVDSPAVFKTIFSNLVDDVEANTAAIAGGVGSFDPDGSVAMTGDLNMGMTNDIVQVESITGTGVGYLLGFADPTSGTHIGNRSYNDDRYVDQGAFVSANGDNYPFDGVAWDLGSIGTAENAEVQANKNQPNGYAGLNANGKIDESLLDTITVVFAGGEAVDVP